MANMCKVTSADGTAIRIGKVRFSYAYVFEPSANDDKYGVSILIPKDNKDAIKLVEEATKVAANNGVTKFPAWKGKVPVNLKKPLRDGDDERPDDETYENMFFLNAKNKNKPKVVYDDGGMAVEATEDEFYSGCWGAVTLQFYPYDNNGNRGVAVSLGNIIKLEDGEKLAGTRSQSVDESFGDLF